MFRIGGKKEPKIWIRTALGRYVEVPFYSVDIQYICGTEDHPTLRYIIDVTTDVNVFEGLD